MFSIRPCRGSSSCECGFSLLEALIATTVIAVGAGSLAQLFILSTSANRGSRATTFVSTLARQKMEQLRASPLDVSPPDALTQNEPGFCEVLDRYGQVVALCAAAAADGTRAPAGMYTRRWSVLPAVGAAGTTMVIQVVVVAAGGGERSRLVSVATEAGGS